MFVPKMSNSQGPIKKLKYWVVGLIGRELANKITGPYHDWRARRRTQKFLANLPKDHLYVNLGCGYRPMNDWINVDHARGPDVQVVWNLTDGLPFPESSCAAIFSEHMIEHISKEDAEGLLR